MDRVVQALNLGAVTDGLVGDERRRGISGGQRKRVNIGIELVTDKAAKTKPDAALDIPQHLARIGYQNGLIFRAFGDGVIGLAPPLTISKDEIDMLVARLGATLDELLENKDIRHALD